MSLYQIARNKAHVSEDRVLDKIFDDINAAMQHNKIRYLEQEFFNLSHNIDKIELEILIGIAIVSLPCKWKILARQDFIKNCFEKYPEENLWKGL